MLQDPEVVTSPDRLKETAREHAELRELMAAYKRHLQVKEEIEESEEIIGGDDPDLSVLAKDDLKSLNAERADLKARLKTLLVPKDPLDGKDIIIEVRAGTGGDEATLFAGELFSMYMKFAEAKGWKTEVLSTSPSEQGGVKEIVAQVSGREVYGHLRYESGVHRVQRVPVTESQGRVHTSAVTVAVLPEAEEVDVQINDADLKIDVYRSQGAGGQHVNTTDSAVRITHKPSGMVVVCQDERSQHKNRARAMKILRARLLDLEQQRQQDERAAVRKSMVRSGDRSEKIRTYNFPQGRVTDHRIGLSLYKLDRIMEGDLDELVEGMATHHRTSQLQGLDHQGA